MNTLAAIKREEKKLEKQLGKLRHQLNGVQAAAKALAARGRSGLFRMAEPISKIAAVPLGIEA
jgi:hypothetical protein